MNKNQPSGLRKQVRNASYFLLGRWKIKGENGPGASFSLDLFFLKDIIALIVEQSKSIILRSFG